MKLKMSEGAKGAAIAVAIILALAFSYTYVRALSRLSDCEKALTGAAQAAAYLDAGIKAGIFPMGSQIEAALQKAQVQAAPKDKAPDPSEGDKKK